MEEKKTSGPSVVKLAVLLMAICAVTSGILGGVNAITKDRIAEITAQKTANAYNEVLPTTGEYTPVDVTADGVVAVAECEEGYVVEMSVSGAQSMISLVVGVDRDLAVTGVSIINLGETPGLGALATDPEFRAQFVGQTEGMALNKKGGDIEALAGATITSQAIVNAATTAIDVVKTLG